ncbi:MAG: hypothetical protein NTV61_09460 [Candidatus Bathyarchaeota archaeon]|nr:hypothetical protein [Candidatus Bathyarchaeota archaeon]
MFRKKKDEDPLFVYESPSTQDIDPYISKKIDTFLEQFNRGDIEFKDAFSVPMSHSGVKSTLGKLLSWQLSNYEIVRNEENNIKKAEIASDCLLLINHAKIVGAVHETESVLSKLEKINKETESLNEENNSLKKEYDELDKQYQRISKEYVDYKESTNKLFGGMGELTR